MFRKLLFPIIMLLVFFGMGVTAMADSDSEADTALPIIIEDSANELLSAETQGISYAQVTPAGMQYQGVTFDIGVFKSSSEFISDKSKSDYVDRMVKYYIDNNTDLKEALAADKSVVMFFEGASDISGKVSEGCRNAAVCLIIKQNQETKENYIAYYNKNSTTLPDYPFAYEYDNGHDGYGTATLLDGIYNIYTRNHRDAYAAFNVRTGNKKCVPCVYMNNKGSFSILNGTGINIHFRPMETVSGDESKPTSAGCLLVGGVDSLISFQKFLGVINSDERYKTEKTTFDGYYLDKYLAESEAQPAGCIVIDRYLGKKNMAEIYGNYEAIETITAFSTLSQSIEKAGAADKLKNLEFYSSYMTGYVSAGKSLLSLPCKGAAAAKTRNGSLLINGLYKNSAGELYYRVLVYRSTYYIAASDVKRVYPRFDDVSIHNAVYPEVKELGKPFSVYGIIAEKYNALTQVNGYITDMSGNIESTASKTDILSSYNLRAEDGWVDYKNSLDYALGFRKLATGNHIYRITANVKNYYVQAGTIKSFDKELTVLEKVFRVAPLVTFNAGDGKVNDAATAAVFADKNGNIKELPVAVLEGKYFDGWYTAEGEKLTSETVFTASTTVTAKWSDTAPEPEQKQEEQQPEQKYTHHSYAFSWLFRTGVTLRSLLLWW